MAIANQPREVFSKSRDPEPSEEKPRAPVANESAAVQDVDGSGESLTNVKIVDLTSGIMLGADHWQGVEIIGEPIKVILTINPAGFLDSWAFLSDVPVAFQGRAAMISVLVRSMKPDKTGETHARVWEGQIGTKDGNWMAKVYEVQP